MREDASARFVPGRSTRRLLRGARSSHAILVADINRGSACYELGGGHEWCSSATVCAIAHTGLPDANSHSYPGRLRASARLLLREWPDALHNNDRVAVHMRGSGRLGAARRSSPRPAGLDEVPSLSGHRGLVEGSDLNSRDARRKRERQSISLAIPTRHHELHVDRRSRLL